MYAPVYPPSVVASVSYCALPLCLPAFGGDTLFKCYFYPNTKRGLARDGLLVQARFAGAASAMFGRKMRLRGMFINTWRRLSGMPLISLCKAFHNHRKAQQSSWSDSKALKSPCQLEAIVGVELHSPGASTKRPESCYDGRPTVCLQGAFWTWFTKLDTLINQLTKWLWIILLMVATWMWPMVGG